MFCLVKKTMQVIHKYGNESEGIHMRMRRQIKRVPQQICAIKKCDGNNKCYPFLMKHVAQQFSQIIKSQQKITHSSEQNA